MKRLVFLSSLLLAACGSKSSTTTTPTGGEGQGSAVAALPDVPFDDLDHDQQIQFMKERVVPTMAPLFQQHDAEEFKDFGCKTCHGPGAEKGEFEMPNNELPKLTFADMSKFVVLPKRWIVERTIAWLNRCRRLSKDWECLNRHALAFLRWASVRLMLRRLCQS